jgi:hypothetical protein
MRMTISMPVKPDAALTDEDGLKLLLKWAKEFSGAVAHAEQHSNFKREALAYLAELYGPRFADALAKYEGQTDGRQEITKLLQEIPEEERSA